MKSLNSAQEEAKSPTVILVEDNETDLLEQLIIEESSIEEQLKRLKEI